MVAPADAKTPAANRASVDRRAARLVITLPPACSLSLSRDSRFKAQYRARIAAPSSTQAKSVIVMAPGCGLAEIGLGWRTTSRLAASRARRDIDRRTKRRSAGLLPGIPKFPRSAAVRFARLLASGRQHCLLVPKPKHVFPGIPRRSGTEDPIRTRASLGSGVLLGHSRQRQIYAEQRG
jgi:hypothetical protein